MDGPRMLSGGELVSLGAMKKIDGKLPEVGIKEVTPSGSWLEQKQVQSALEARKNLIEVARIEKSGSLSHAVWRDDMQLAEVTQQTGGHWQYIGHSVGKQLYLQPEEALFLMEVNCLLLKHNEVTVSLQKAYSLCLGDISIAQYKVYASLSRLGYRVVRHKEPIPKTSDMPIDLSQNKNISDDMVSVECTQKSHEYDNKEQQSDKAEEINQINDATSNNSQDKSEKNESCANTEIKTSEVTTYDGRQINKDTVNEVSRKAVKNEIAEHFVAEGIVEANNENLTPSNNEGDNPLIDADNVKVEIVENHTGSEVIENDINNAIEKTLQSSGIDPGNEFQGSDEISPMDTPPAFNEDLVSNNVIVNNRITTENLNALPTMDIDGNTNGTSTDDNDNIVTDNRVAIINNYIERTNTVSPAVIYSVDGTGVVRVFGDNSMEIDAVESIQSDSDTDCNTAEAKDPGSSNNDSTKRYDTEITYYNKKLQKLTKRKSNEDQTCKPELKTLQDFNQDVVYIEVPDEKYLPRNVFLHKPAYVLNKDVVRNQNASNTDVSNNERDSSESPNRGNRSTDAPSLTDLPRFVPSQPSSFSYSAYRPLLRTPIWNPRQNNMYCNYVLRPTLNHYMTQKYRYHNYAPQYANYNVRSAVPIPNQSDKRNETKMFHYNTMVQIATRFKNCVSAPAQVRALHSLVNTFNIRYRESFELTPCFNIVDKKKLAREVIVLDDDSEPIRKKPRLSDDNEKKANLEKLNELAAKLKGLHAKNLAVSRHRRVFSNAIKTFNKTFKAELHLDSNFEIKDKRLIVLDSSSDSDAVVIEKSKSKSRKRLRNPYNILKHGLKNVDDGASTSQQVPILQTLSLNVINESAASVNGTCANNITMSPIPEHNGECEGDGLLKYFKKGWLPSDDDFGRPELCSREKARLDSMLFRAEYLYGLKESVEEIKTWLDLKIAILNNYQRHLDLQKQQAEALTNDFLMETESQIQPIVKPDCTDLRTALKQLAIISTNKEIPTQTSLRIHFDVCNRDVHYKKTNPPKPNFRVVCLDELAAFPSSSDVVALQAKYKDSVPTVYAFVGTGSITYLQINSIDLPVFIPDNDLG